MSKQDKNEPVFALTFANITEIVDCILDNELDNSAAEQYVKAWLFDHEMGLRRTKGAKT